MRKIILSLNITKDDFVAGQGGSLDWHLPYWNLEMCEALGKLLSTCDTILLGRNTYNAFAAYWIIRGNDIRIPKDDIAFADMMTRYKKVVVSRSSVSLPWSNSMLVRHDVLSEIRKLKEKQGKNIIVMGSCQLASYLIGHDLVDEYYLWVHPIMIKRGVRLPGLTTYLSGARLVQSQEFSCGVIKVVFDKVPVSPVG